MNKILLMALVCVSTNAFAALYADGRAQEAKPQIECESNDLAGDAHLKITITGVLETGFAQATVTEGNQKPESVVVRPQGTREYAAPLQNFTLSMKGDCKTNEGVEASVVYNKKTYPTMNCHRLLMNY